MGLPTRVKTQCMDSETWWYPQDSDTTLLHNDSNATSFNGYEKFFFFLLIDMKSEELERGNIIMP